MASPVYWSGKGGRREVGGRGREGGGRGISHLDIFFVKFIS